MLILEGPDRCGKTTLAQALLKQLPGWGYRHHTKPPVPPFEYFGWIADARPTVIIDRLHWSECAYGTVYRDQVRLTPHEWRILEMILLTHRATIIRLTDHPAAITERYDAKEMYSADKVVDLVRQYDALTEGGWPGYLTAVPSATYRWPELMDGEVLTSMGRWLVDQEADQSMGFPPPTAGLGYVDRGGWVLIGEAPGYSALMDPTFRGPRVPWGRGRAADWLWRALDLAGADWRKGYLTNASYLENLDVRHLMKSLQPRAIVTVGYVARSLAVRHNLNQIATVTHLKHPGYEQRFKRSDLATYSGQLGEALKDFVLPVELRCYDYPVMINGGDECPADA